MGRGLPSRTVVPGGLPAPLGGALYAATARDVLTTGWDQLAFNAWTSPAAAVVEDVTGGRLKELLGPPSESAKLPMRFSRMRTSP